jgi:hypothetical protein
MLLSVTQHFLDDGVVVSCARLDHQLHLRMGLFEFVGEVDNGRDDRLAAATPDQDVTDLARQAREPLGCRNVRVVVGILLLEAYWVSD